MAERDNEDKRLQWFEHVIQMKEFRILIKSLETILKKIYRKFTNKWKVQV